MLEVYTQYSIQEAFGRIQEYVKRAFDLKLPCLAITDVHSLSGSVEFLQEIEKFNNKSDHKIIPIIGMTVNVKHETGFEKIQLLAKSLDGYYNLCKILALTTIDIDNQYILIDNINKYSDHLIVLGYSDIIYKTNCLNKFKYNIDINNKPVYYVNKDDKLYQQIITCSKYKETLKEFKENLLSHKPYEINFFQDDHDFYLMDSNDIRINNIISLINVFSLSRKPQIPSINKNADQIIAERCREGWKEKQINKLSPEIKDKYVARIKMELEVFAKANLSGYMLIVDDLVQFARKNKVSAGLRGSGGGCLISYLLNISTVDPLWPDPTLPYSESRELIFSRFYCDARNSEHHKSLPDIDLDIGIKFRDKLISYIQEKYGKEYTSYIITFGRLDGRGAIKEIFRILEPVNHAFEIANEITSHMVDTAKVQDILEDIKEEKPDYTIINYCIDHIPKIAEYYKEYKEPFDMAIKLCNTIRNRGRHAAGIVISNEKISNIGPIMYDEGTGEPIIGFEMADAEYAGFVKFDILAVAAYEKIDEIVKMINNNLVTVGI